MKLLIAYASRNGVTRRCAQMLADSLPDTVETELVDIKATEVSIEQYDALVLGGSVIAGRIDKRIKKIMRSLKKSKSQLPCALFICCGLSQRFEEYADTQPPIGYFPSLGVHHFGGELKPDKVKGFDKLVVRHMRKSINELDFEDGDTSDISLPEIIPENILLLSEELKKLAKSIKS